MTRPTLDSASIFDRFVKPVGPRAFLRVKHRAAQGTVVVCAGDSITHGLMSANYVTMLQASLGESGFTFVNAGISGDLAYNLFERLGDVIACRPDVVTVLIGTNDVAAHIDNTWRDTYVKQQKLPQRPTRDWYRTMLEAIVKRLHAETDARVYLLEIPPLGEDLTSVHNQRVGEYNTVVKAVGDAHDVAVLPLNARLASRLARASCAPQFDGSKRLMGRAIAQRVFLRRSWDNIATRHGLSLLTDHVHFAERAAREVADLLIPHLVEGG